MDIFAVQLLTAENNILDENLDMPAEPCENIGDRRSGCGKPMEIHCGDLQLVRRMSTDPCSGGSKTSCEPPVPYRDVAPGSDPCARAESSCGNTTKTSSDGGRKKVTCNSKSKGAGSYIHTPRSCCKTCVQDNKKGSICSCKCRSKRWGRCGCPTPCSSRGGRAKGTKWGGCGRPTPSSSNFGICSTQIKCYTNFVSGGSDGNFNDIKKGATTTSSSNVCECIRDTPPAYWTFIEPMKGVTPRTIPDLTPGQSQGIPCRKAEKRGL